MCTAPRCFTLPMSHPKYSLQLHSSAWTVSKLWSDFEAGTRVWAGIYLAPQPNNADQRRGTST